MPPEKNKTTMVRRKVAKLEGIPVTPILPNKAVNPAKKAEPMAKYNQEGIIDFSTSYLFIGHNKTIL